MPSQNGIAATGEGTLRLKGVKNLNPLTAKTHTADLDDQLIVLFAAGELLARQKAPDAQMKMGQAQSHYQKIKGRLSKGDPIVFGNDQPDLYKTRGPIVIAQGT